MLNEKLVTQKLYEFALNYSIDIKQGYSSFIYKQLNEKGFTDIEFIKIINELMETQTTTFNKMPNLAMFMKYSDRKALTLEEEAEVRTSKVMEYLADCHYTSEYGETVWVFDKDHNFDYETMILIDSQFGSVENLVEEFRNRFKNREWFEKDLLDKFRTQDLIKQKEKILYIINKIQNTLTTEPISNKKNETWKSIGGITDDNQTNR